MGVVPVLFAVRVVLPGEHNVADAGEIALAKVQLSVVPEQGPAPQSLPVPKTVDPPPLVMVPVASMVPEPDRVVLPVEPL